MSHLREARPYIYLWGFTGLFSLILNAATGAAMSEESARALQTAALLLAVFGSLALALRAQGMRSWRDLAITLAPALGALALGIFALPALFLPALGVALGWLLVVALMLRRQLPAAQRAAIRHWRRGDYPAAMTELERLFAEARGDSERLRQARILRAQILLAWGKPERAARDALALTKAQPEFAAAHNLLAEARLQAGELNAARAAAEKARELAPADWVAAYNLGMIADRQQDGRAAAAALQDALDLRIGERRHRALAWLWLARAHCRLREAAAAGECLEQLRAEDAALREWARLLVEEAAAPLRALVAEDVALARRLVKSAGDDVAALEELGCGG